MISTNHRKTRYADTIKTFNHSDSNATKTNEDETVGYFVELRSVIINE